MKVIRHFINWVIADPGTKIMALCLAIIVWFYLDYEYTEKSGPIEVPLKLIVPDNIIAVVKDNQGNLLNTVKIILEGPRGLLRVRPDQPGDIICTYKVELPPNFTNETQRIIDLKEKDFNLPPRVKVREIMPSQVQITLLQKGQKYLYLDTKNCLKGVPPKSYQIQINTEPSGVLVYGPKNILDLYNEIPIEPIDIQNKTSSFSLSGRIINKIEDYPIWTNDHFVVHVEIKGGLEEYALRVPINVLQPVGFPYQVKVKPPEAEIKLKGPPLAMKNLKQQHVNVFVNLYNLYTNPRDIRPGSFTTQPNFILLSEAPPGISLAEPLNQVTVEVLKLK